MKSKIFILTALVGLASASCSDYLDKEVDRSLKAENVFNKFDNTRGFLANIYTYLPDAFVGYNDEQYRGASRDCMTDNAISYWNVHYYHGIQTDGFFANNHPFASTFWNNNYKAIRACNIFMTYASPDVIGNKGEADGVTGDDANLYDRYMAEARILRAIFHLDLASWFGDVVVLGDDEDGNPIVLTPGESSDLNRPRTNAADVFKWIADEMDAIKDNLPFRYSNEVENWGRINGATAYAVKSRALLYRASKLHNPDGNTTWWKEAADAALDFIKKNANQSNPYALYTNSKVDEINGCELDPNANYYNCFVSTPHLNPEYIISRSEWTTRNIERMLSPCGFTGAEKSIGRTNPTQNLVDCYETVNGLPIDEDPTYDAANPYANRDPRLNQTILHQGSIWGDAEQEEQRPVDVRPDGADYQELHGGTTTGYYTKKFLNNMSFKKATNYVHACPIFRYAEILLNAAEALNEAGSTGDAYEYVNQVRARVGMPPYVGMSQDRLRERIRNERRIELCFEDHRFFDERRWMLFAENGSASAEKTKPVRQQVFNLYSMSVGGEAEAPTYSVVPNSMHNVRVFNAPKNYYFPIPESEVKMVPSLGQNEGW
ncbi:MAG: RagB/SusD family nutrient uptake outer membrane protein [Bacteroidales bacterium]|nr:RagB/SusD family nutrient uptake outer membrane protein [Bacteroidales bacterium]